MEVMLSEFVLLEGWVGMVLYCGGFVHFYLFTDF